MSLAFSAPMILDEDRIRALPCWNGALDIAPLAGGLSNANFLVADSSGKYVVRFGVEYPFHHVSREREIMVARAAHEAGFAPKLMFAAAGTMVSQFIAGKTFASVDVRENAGRIARLLHDFHHNMASRMSGPAFMFWAFHVNRDYAITLRNKNSRHAHLLGAMMRQNEAFEKAQVPLPVIFGHHDLLPANFIDDGKKLWLIDFEYAGFGTAMFDLAGAASNSQMNHDQSQQFLHAYLGHTPDIAFKKSFAAMQCASLLRETLWAMVSEIFLNAPGADYGSYVADNFALYEKSLEHYQSVYGKIS